MTYASWEPRYRVTTIKPGKLDLFTITLIDGKRASVDPIDRYHSALAKAEAFLRDHQCQIKVLPVTGVEVRNMLGIDAPDHPEPMDAALRQQMVDMLSEVVRDSSDGDARRDALDLLREMGVMQS